MRKFIIILLLLPILYSCSKPTKFLVKKAIDSQTIELEDGTIVKLIGIDYTTPKYIDALNKLVNDYVLLYDENYDPIKEIEEGSINAYVYNLNEECLNDMVNGESNESINETSTKITASVISHMSGNPTSERISGKMIEAMSTSTLSEMYEKNKYAVFLIAVPKSETSYAQGTGFFISASGIGVSNYHVFEGCDYHNAIIKTIDGIQYKIKSIVKSNKELDYIVFEVENDHFDFPYLLLANSISSVGDDVFAIGNPKGLEHTLSKGIISSYRDNNLMIQTTTEITHGSSGGPLFNMRGEVIGITTSGVGEADLNFAMNINELGILDLIK